MRSFIIGGGLFLVGVFINFFGWSIFGHEFKKGPCNSDGGAVLLGIILIIAGDFICLLAGTQ